jgi:hypothetical protein
LRAVAVGAVFAGTKVFLRTISLRAVAVGFLGAVTPSWFIAK